MLSIWNWIWNGILNVIMPLVQSQFISQSSMARFRARSKKKKHFSYFPSGKFVNKTFQIKIVECFEVWTHNISNKIYLRKSRKLTHSDIFFILSDFYVLFYFNTLSWYDRKQFLGNLEEKKNSSCFDEWQSVLSCI